MAKRSTLSPEKYKALCTQVLKRDGWQCRNPRCKRRNNLHVHHIIFRSQRGKDTSSNLVTICHNCHDQIHTPAENIGKLIILAKSGDPKDTPNADLGLRFIDE